MTPRRIDATTEKGRGGATIQGDRTTEGEGTVIPCKNCSEGRATKGIPIEHDKVRRIGQKVHLPH